MSRGDAAGMHGSFVLDTEGCDGWLLHWDSTERLAMYPTWTDGSCRDMRTSSNDFQQRHWFGNFSFLTFNHFGRVTGGIRVCSDSAESVAFHTLEHRTARITPAAGFPDQQNNNDSGSHLLS